MIVWLEKWLAYKQWQRDYYLMSGQRSILTFKEFLKEYESKQ